MSSVKRGGQCRGETDSSSSDEETDEESSASSFLRLRPITDPEDDVTRPIPLHDILEEEEEFEEDIQPETPLPQVLDKFRTEWRQELQKHSAASSANQGGRHVTTPEQRSGSESLRSSRGVSPAESGRMTPMNAVRKGSYTQEEIFEQAKSLFLRGVENEQNGRMHDAIRCYTQSVHLVSDIETRVYSASQRLGGVVANSGSQESSQPESRCSTPTEGMDDFDDLMSFFSLRVYENGVPKSCKRSEWAPSHQLHFSDLPTEVTMQIFRWVVGSELDLRQLEKVTEVCAGFYVLAKSQEFWRQACLRTWGIRTGILDETYPSWREMYIHRPHVWHNGVYISKVTYVRQGETSFQDSFYRPWHLVVYYRYLRFYANGFMAMLTTADDPQTVVPCLRSHNPRYQGVIKGTYRLIGKDCVSAYLIRVKKNHTESMLVYPYSRKKGQISSYEPVEHIFSLTLKIGSTRHKKHVQLQWLNYESTAKYRNGQETVTQLDINDQSFPAMYYSRVRSYTAQSSMPLT